MKEKFGDKFEIVAISMSYDPAEQVAKFIEKNPYPFSFVRDTDGQMSQAFGEVLLTPTNFLIARTATSFTKKSVKSISNWSPNVFVK